MYKIISVFIALSLFFVLGCGNGSEKNKEDLQGTISVSGSFALYPLSKKWAEEFQKLHPKLKINISAIDSEKVIMEVLSGLINIGMVSRKISKEDVEKGTWSVAVAKDAVVPIINENNPDLQKLNKYGLSKETLKDIFISGKITSWGQTSNDKKINERIKLFKCTDVCGAIDIWAKYLGGKQEDILGKDITNVMTINNAVINDKNSISFNSIYYIYNSKTKYLNTGIRILPVDFNDNGIIDDNEYFYQHRDSIVNAIADGRYPSLLVREFYLVCKGKPVEKNVLAFLKWILTDGQKYATEVGYINLPNIEVKAELKKLK